jgi:NAD(P)-dependent dehydrogenase (short-subunit alcohol dehydrogenase family)
MIVAMTDSELVMVFGGRSEIGMELAARLASGARVLLVARGSI